MSGDVRVVPVAAGGSERGRALVTGGTDGVGLEIARGLARAGHPLIIVGRDAEKGARAEGDLRGAGGAGEVRYLRADLGLVSEARRLADEVSRRWPALRYLVHSAGIVSGRREITSEGIETNFAVNYLGRFVLTEGLRPLLDEGGRPGNAARVVILSGAARNGTIHYEDVNLTSRFGIVRAVRQFCRANDLFTLELARRLAAAGAGGRITVTSLKLGVVKTGIRRGFPGWMKWLVPVLLDPVLAQSPREAAESALGMLLDRELEGVTGALFLKIRKLVRIDPAAGASDPMEGRRLWELSELLAARAGSSPGHVAGGVQRAAS